MERQLPRITPIIMTDNKYRFLRKCDNIDPFLVCDVGIDANFSYDEDESEYEKVDEEILYYEGSSII